MARQAGPILLPGDKVFGRTHRLDEAWLRARAAGWMRVHSQSAWWLMAITAEGKFVYSAERGPRREAWTPVKDEYELARRALRAVNKEASHGGAWLVGYRDGELYMIWKDRDGDIQIEWCAENITHAQLLEWSDLNFALQAEMMWAQWDEWHKSLEYGKGQRKKLAQGEKLSDAHDKTPIET